VENTEKFDWKLYLTENASESMPKTLSAMSMRLHSKANSDVSLKAKQNMVI